MTSKKQMPREWIIVEPNSSYPYGIVRQPLINEQYEHMSGDEYWAISKMAYEAAQAEAEKYKSLAEALREALNEMWYQAKRTYGTEEKILASEPFPWGLVKEALEEIRKLQGKVE
jgi:hypothetical protein